MSYIRPSPKELLSQVADEITTYLADAPHVDRLTRVILEGWLDDLQQVLVDMRWR